MAKPDIRLNHHLEVSAKAVLKYRPDDDFTVKTISFYRKYFKKDVFFSEIMVFRYVVLLS
jgi:hypothetical protein